jgi:ribosome-associated protein
MPAPKKKNFKPVSKSKAGPKPLRRKIIKKPIASKAKSRSESVKPVVKKVASKIPAHVIAIVRALDDKKAESIRILELGQLSSVADYMIIATGTSDPHLRALRIEVEKALDEIGSPARGIESQKESGWTVVDGFDVIVHIFRP